MLVADPDRSSPHPEHVLSINRIERQSANSNSAGILHAGAFLYELQKASGGSPGTLVDSSVDPSISRECEDAPREAVW